MGFGTLVKSVKIERTLKKAKKLCKILITLSKGSRTKGILENLWKAQHQTIGQDEKWLFLLYKSKNHKIRMNIKKHKQPKPPQGGQQEIDHPAPMMAGRLNKP